jgi:hypothetical protein
MDRVALRPFPGELRGLGRSARRRHHRRGRPASDKACNSHDREAIIGTACSSRTGPLLSSTRSDPPAFRETAPRSVQPNDAFPAQDARPAAPSRINAASRFASAERLALSCGPFKSRQDAYAWNHRCLARSEQGSEPRPFRLEARQLQRPSYTALLPSVLVRHPDRLLDAGLFSTLPDRTMNRNASL